MKFLITSILFTSSLFAQGTNTIFQQMFNNLPVASIGNSASVRNIGQQYHVITVTATGTCSSTGIISLFASYDGVIFSQIGVSVTPASFIYQNHSPSVIGTAVTSASGAYPYVRVGYTQAFGGCSTISVNYSGTLTGTLIGSAPFTAVQDTFSYANLQISSMSPNTMVSCPAPNQGMQIYALTVTAPGGANTVTVSRVDGSGGGAVTSWLINIPLTTTNPNFIFPQGTRPFMFAVYRTPLNGLSVLHLQSSAATEVDYEISYRCE